MIYNYNRANACVLAEQLVVLYKIKHSLLLTFMPFEAQSTEKHCSLLNRKTLL